MVDGGETSENKLQRGWMVFSLTTITQNAHSASIKVFETKTQIRKAKRLKQSWLSNQKKMDQNFNEN